MGGSNTLFYSRRIGLVGDVDSDDLQAVRIYGGARLVGRLGGWTSDSWTCRRPPLRTTPGELRRASAAPPDDQPYSYVGGILTSRLAAGGGYNVAYGLDGIWRVKATITSRCNGPRRSRTAPPTAPSPRFVEDRGDVGAADDGRLRDDHAVRPGRARFQPGHGLHDDGELHGLLHPDPLRLVPGKGSALSNHDAFVEARVYLDNATKDLTLAEFGPGWEFTTRSGVSGFIWPKMFVEELSEPFELSDDVAVPAGRYAYPGLTLRLQTPPAGCSIPW